MQFISAPAARRGFCVLIMMASVAFGSVYHAQDTKTPGRLEAAPKDPVAAPNRVMPEAEENALVQKYCAVCHDDAHRNGGLSLQHFNASEVEPSLAAMMVSKLKSGAMGAAGIGVPDSATEKQFLTALQAKSVNANAWTLTRTREPGSQAQLLTASIVVEQPPAAAIKDMELYRLKLTCRPETREGELQLTWSPQPAQSPSTISAAADGGTPVLFKIEGREKMGNGAKQADGTDATSGPAAAILYTRRPTPGATNLSMPLPSRTLVVSNILSNDSIVFPFDQMTQPIKQQLSTCFAGN
jgi:hypothetical protein